MNDRWVCRLANRGWLRCLVVASVLAAAPVQALDRRLYADADGDLVADVPSAVVDPSTLVFAYTPGEDPATYAQVWGGFLRHLEAKTGKPVKLFAAQSNAVQIETMRAGRLHIAGFSTGTVPLAVNCAGFVPFAVMGTDKGMLGYEMEIVTYPGSGITRPEDLKGRKVAFTSPTSNSGFKTPSLVLARDFKLEAEKDFTAVFSGKHENSIQGVAHRDYDAAAIANEVLRRMIAKGVVQRDQFVTIYRSETFPTAAFGLAHNLAPALADKVREAFFTFPWGRSDLEKEYAVLGATRFLPITYKKDWAIVRKVDAEIGATNDDCK